MGAFRRLNFKITLLLVISFMLIVALFLSVLLPFQREQLQRFVDDRRSFLDNLVQGRGGDICHWWVQQSGAAHWHQFQKTLLANPNILHTTLYYLPKAVKGQRGSGEAVERLAVTSDPDLVEETSRAALAAGIELVPHPDADGKAGSPFLVAVGDELWVRTAEGKGLRGDMKDFKTREAPPDVSGVGVEGHHRRDTLGSQRSLHYCALIYLGDSRKVSFSKVGHLVIRYGLSDLDEEESSILSLFYGLLAALFLVLLVLLNLSLGRSVVRPIRGVLEAMRKAGAGDLEVQLEKRSHDEIGMMADRFNQMVQDLKRSKEAIEEYNRTLEQRVKDRTRKLVKSEERARELKDHLSAVLGHVQAGVFALDGEDRIVTFNERAGELLDLDPGGVVGKPMEEVFGTTPLDPVRRVLRKARGRSAAMEEFKLGPPGKVKTFRIAVTALEGGGEVVVLDDVTDLIYSKRLLAWREAVERVIHDIKNPLTPIRLTAQQIRVAYEDRSPDLERIVDRGTTNILSSVDNLQNMLADFSLLYRRPRAEPGPVDMNGLVSRVLDEQAPALEAGINPVKELAAELPSVKGDSLSLWRLMTNVIQNGLEAMKGRAGRFKIRTEAGGDHVRITVLDEGTGIPPERLDKLFEPYFTTKAKGTGLGLVIARQIVEDHGGRIEIRSVEGEGTRVEIRLPLT